MKHLKSIKFSQLRNMYDIIAGWGNAPIEFEKRYNPLLYKLDYLINGESKGEGEIVCGNKILGPHALLEKVGKICFVLYTNKENILLEQINQLYPNADTIVGRLIEPDNTDIRPRTYSTDCEDLILLGLIKKLGFKEDFPYMDIGVCHPVVRNNTFMIYENGYTNGLLVEPNPSMADLASEYRPKNRIINMGVASASGVLPYVSYKDKIQPGRNHFLREGEQINDYQIITDIPVKNINEVIADNFKDYPYLLDIDAERMDYEILKAIDMKKYPIKIICAEESKKDNIRMLLQDRGYIHYTSTRENQIFIRNDCYTTIVKN